MKKYLIILSLLQCMLFATNTTDIKYSSKVVPKKMSVAEKKRRFFALLVPAVEDAYKELYLQYLEAKKDIQHNSNPQKIAYLKRKYKVKTDRELLVALKPHPVSITLAQAAMESAWGTSRFFREANNIFGVHGLSEKGCVAAGIKKGNKTVWVRKYKTLEDAIKAYYYMLSTVPNYKEFKELNYAGKSVYDIIQGLKEYSERADGYVIELASMIRFNKLIKYDTKVAKEINENLL